MIPFNQGLHNSECRCTGFPRGSDLSDLVMTRDPREQHDVHVTFLGNLLGSFFVQRPSVINYLIFLFGCLFIPSIPLSLPIRFVFPGLSLPRVVDTGYRHRQKALVSVNATSTKQEDFLSLRAFFTNYSRFSSISNKFGNQSRLDVELHPFRRSLSLLFENARSFPFSLTLIRVGLALVALQNAFLIGYPLFRVVWRARLYLFGALVLFRLFFLLDVPEFFKQVFVIDVLGFTLLGIGCLGRGLFLLMRKYDGSEQSSLMLLAGMGIIGWVISLFLWQHIENPEMFEIFFLRSPHPPLPPQLALIYLLLSSPPAFIILACLSAVLLASGLLCLGQFFSRCNISRGLIALHGLLNLIFTLAFFVSLLLSSPAIPRCHLLGLYFQGSLGKTFAIPMWGAPTSATTSIRFDGRKNP